MISINRRLQRYRQSELMFMHSSLQSMKCGRHSFSDNTEFITLTKTVLSFSDVKIAKTNPNQQSTETLLTTSQLNEESNNKSHY